MRQRAISLVGVLALVLLGFRGNSPGPQPAPALAAASIQEKQGPKPVSPQRPRNVPPAWEAFCKLNPDFGTVQPAEPDWETLGDKTFVARCLGAGHPAILSIIASVPDPRHTHLGFVLDRTIDAIQAAARQASYSLEVQAIPWPSSPSNAAQDSTEPQRPQTLKDASESSDPGVLIFRRCCNSGQSATAAPEYLAVFLVPEVPTSGLDRQAFFTAVRIINAISPDALTLPFAGPMFSGSVESLYDIATALKKTDQQGVNCIRAVSGSVTNAPLASDTSDPATTRCVSLTFLQTPDDDALRFLIPALKTMYGYSPSEIAILSEEGTPYGYQTRRDSSNGVLYLNFPREISRLRNAYGSKTPQTGAAANGNQDQLPLNWQDPYPGTGDDTPSYGGSQTPFSEDAVLASLAVTIQAQGIKALGILGTDPWDVAFLIRSFKRSSPDARLFIRDPDLLYLGISDAGSLSGVLAINNYPLIRQNQLWAGEGQGEDADNVHLVTMPSAQQEAEYNAITTLLKEVDAYDPKLAPSFVESGWPSGVPETTAKNSARPLWLAVTGTTGYFPIRLLNDPPSPPASFGIHAFNVGRPPYLAILLWGFISLIGLVHAAAATFYTVVPRRFQDEFDFCDKTDGVTVIKAFCHVLALLTLCLASLVAGSSFIFFISSLYTIAPLGIPIRAYVLLAIAVSLQILTIGAAAAWRSYDSVLRPTGWFKKEIKFPRTELGSVGKLWPIATAIGAALFLGAFGFCIWMVAGTTFDRAFLYFRNLQLGSGVAPNVPIVFLLGVIYLGIWAYLGRVARWEYGSVEMPEPRGLDEVFPSDFMRHVKAIDKWTFYIPERVWICAASCTLALAFLAFRPWTTIDMVEVKSVRWFAVGTFFFAFFFLWWNWFRFLGIWRRLRNILQNLEKLPLRAAFNRLPRESSLPIWRWSIWDGSFLPICQGVNTFRALVRLDANAIKSDAQQRFTSSVRDFYEEAGSKASGESLVVAEPERAMVYAVGAKLPVTVAAPTRTGIKEPDGNTQHAIEGLVKAAPKSGTALHPCKTATSQKQRLHDMRKAMTDVIEQLIPFLRNYWMRGSSPSPTTSELADPADRKFVLAEDLIAIRFYAYIRYVVSELRSLLFFMVVAFSLLFVALHTYAFRSDQAIDWSLIGLFFVLGGGIVFVLAQMERDALLSRLDNSTSGQLGTGFYLNIIKYGIVPALTILGSQVPSISNLVLRWVQPALQAFR